MISPTPCDDCAPAPLPYRPGMPRISGSAMPTGVFLSAGTGTTTRASTLFLTGVTLAALGLTSAIPVYLLVWLADQHLHLSLTAMLLQVGGPADPVISALARICLNILSFFSFITLLRLSPLAGYHAAEHMTVHAIERYGPYEWQDHVAEMTPVHARCGSNLLSGILPTLLLGVPLFALQPLATLAVMLLGWRFRHVTGSWLQRWFTTKTPSAHQLQQGIEAGQRVLMSWFNGLRAPSVAQRIWYRGAPQLVAGVMLALYVLGFLGDRIPGLLDW